MLNCPQTVRSLPNQMLDYLLEISAHLMACHSSHPVADSGSTNKQGKISTWPNASPLFVRPGYVEGLCLNENLLPPYHCRTRTCYTSTWRDIHVPRFPKSFLSSIRCFLSIPSRRLMAKTIQPVLHPPRRKRVSSRSCQWRLLH